MLLEFLSLILLFISIFGWGIWSILIFNFKPKSNSCTLISGIILFTIIVSILSFFIPLGLKTEIVLLVFSLIPYFFKGRYYITDLKNISSPKWFYFLSLLVLIISCFPPFILDHFIYYLPTLNWINQYGIIKGVANIDWNLGQMSFFHIMQAGFDNTIDPFQRMNVLITAIYLLYIFERKAYVLLFFLPFSFFYLQSPSPDLLVIFFCLLVVYEILYSKEELNYSLLLTISTFVFVVKPIAFWLPIWVIIVFLYQDKKKLFSFKYYILPLFLTILYIGKNIYTSSVLFFPVTEIKIFTDWIPDLRILQDSDKFAVLRTYHETYTLQEISSFTVWERIYHWLTFKSFKSIIHCLMLVVVLTYFVLAIRKKSFILYSLGAVVLIKLMFIFNFSGQYRFMLDGILPLLLVLLYAVKIKEKWIFIFISSITFLFIILLNMSVFQKIIPTLKISKGSIKTFFRPSVYKLEKYKVEKVGNLTFNLSTHYNSNFDTPAPAFIPYKLYRYDDWGIFPQLIDSSDIRKGIYMKNLSGKEKQQLKTIIEENKNGSK